MRLLPIWGGLAISANLQAQPQAAYNRQSDSEKVFFYAKHELWKDRQQHYSAFKSIEYVPVMFAFGRALNSMAKSAIFQSASPRFERSKGIAGNRPGIRILF